MFDLFTKFLVATQVRLAASREQGQGFTEYAILLIVIAMVVLGVAKLFGGTVRDLFTQAINGLQGN